MTGRWLMIHRSNDLGVATTLRVPRTRRETATQAAALEALNDGGPWRTLARRHGVVRQAAHEWLHRSVPGSARVGRRFAGGSSMSRNSKLSLGVCRPWRPGTR